MVRKSFEVVLGAIHGPTWAPFTQRSYDVHEFEHAENYNAGFCVPETLAFNPWTRRGGWCDRGRTGGLTELTGVLPYADFGIWIHDRDANLFLSLPPVGLRLVRASIIFCRQMCVYFMQWN